MPMVQRLEKEGSRYGASLTFFDQSCLIYPSGDVSPSHPSQLRGERLLLQFLILFIMLTRGYTPNFGEAF